MTAAFLNYGIFYLPLSLNRHLLIAALVFSGLYLLGQRFKHPLASPAGELLFTVLAFGERCIRDRPTSARLRARGIFPRT